MSENTSSVHSAWISSDGESRSLYLTTFFFFFLQNDAKLYRYKKNYFHNIKVILQDFAVYLDCCILYLDLDIYHPFFKEQNTAMECSTGPKITCPSFMVL